MRRKKGNAFWVFIFAQMMIFILAIQGSRLVISTTQKTDVPSGSYTVYACEGNALTIACKENESIHIEYVNYGRSNPPKSHGLHQCYAILEPNKTCSSSVSLSTVRDLCSGKSNCSVLANSSVFGDPCVGKLKYLKVIYQCLPVTELNGSLTVFACEGSELTISCKENESIHIVDANYGRNNRQAPPGIPSCYLNSDVNYCSSNNSLSIVRRQCSGKSNCSVLANSSVFGDPCHGILKYLKVIHGCLSVLSGSYTVYACEGNALTIACKENENIHIEYANYGRTISSESHGINQCYAAVKTNCSSTVSLSKVRELCSGKSNCSVLANNSMFGDPCPGRLKYLKVIHQCYSGGMTVPPDDETTSDTDLIMSSIFTSSMKRELATPSVSVYAKTDISTSEQSDEYVQNFLDGLTKAKRLCGSKAEWNREVDLSECISKEVIALQDKLENLARNFSLTFVQELVDGLEEKVSTGDDLYGGDLEVIAKIMVGAIALTERNGEMNSTDVDRILESVVNTTSILLEQKNNDTWMDLPKTNQSSTATRLLWSVESSSALRASSISEAQHLKITGPGLDVYVYVMKQENFSKSLNIHDKVNYLGHKDILQEARNGLGRVTVALFDAVGQWLHVNESATKYPHLNATSAECDSCSESKPVVNTRVMSISIVPRPANDSRLKENVRFTLGHLEVKRIDSNPICVFWKYSKETFEGYWSEEGCRDVSSCFDCNYTVCECEHLTSFAVLMSVSGHKLQMSEIAEHAHAFALSMITYIGCTISIICLALAFITFYWFKDLQCVRNTIHKNLVLSLFISEVIFLFGIDQYEHMELCAVEAGFLHYFFLASFSWMFLEGVQLYVLLVEVFEARTFRLRWYYFCGYGVPALIVLISAVATYAQGNRYAAEEYCWLTTEHGLIWAFAGPVAVITCVNSVVLGVAIHTMHTSKTSSLRNTQKSNMDTIASWVRGAVVLLVLLGSTWVFGFFYVNKDSLFMAYIFTILNSLQGLFIFVFHCLTFEKVQKEYRRCIQRCTWLPEYVRVEYGGLNVTSFPSRNNPTESLGIPSSDCLDDHDKSMDLGSIITRVDDKEASPSPSHLATTSV